MSEQSTVRDQLRAATLGSAVSLPREIIEVNGMEFEVRGPTVGQEQAIQTKATTVDQMKKTVTVDAGVISCEALLELVYVPGTDEKVFERGDLDAIRAADSNGWVDKLATAAVSMMNGKPPGKDEALPQTQSED